MSTSAHITAAGDGEPSVAQSAGSSRPCLPHAEASPGQRCGDRQRATRCARHEAEYQGWRNARRAGDYGPEYRAERRRVLQGVTVCPECGREATRRNPMTADHIVPRAHGGGVIGNLRPRCKECNSRRGATVRS